MIHLLSNDASSHSLPILTTLLIYSFSPLPFTLVWALESTLHIPLLHLLVLLLSLFLISELLEVFVLNVCSLFQSSLHITSLHLLSHFISTILLILHLTLTHLKFWGAKRLSVCNHLDYKECNFSSRFVLLKLFGVLKGINPCLNFSPFGRKIIRQLAEAKEGF